MLNCSIFHTFTLADYKLVCDSEYHRTSKWSFYQVRPILILSYVKYFHRNKKSSHPVAELACRRNSAAATASLIGPSLRKSTGHEAYHDEYTTNLIRVASQIIVPSYTRAQVLVTTSASGLLVIQHYFRGLSRRRRSLHAAWWTVRQ